MTAMMMSSSQATEDVGRLPAPVVQRPLSEERFAELARVWRSCGAFLTLWNADGAVVSHDEEAPKFWRMLWSKGPELWKKLSVLVSSAMHDPNGDVPSDSAWLAPMDAWASGIAVMIAPIRAGRGPIGAVAAALRATSTMSEDFAGLCHIDTAEGGCATSTQAARAEGISGLAQLLQSSVDQCHDLEAAHVELAALTSNLDSTYEELHLMYGISSILSLSNDPAQVLVRVGQEVLQTSRAAGLAFVFRETAVDAPSHPGGGYSSSRLSDRIVQVGAGAPTRAELDRLVEHLSIQSDGAPTHLLLNNVAHRPELDWASGWLRHLVVLPMWRQRELMGVMLAINCTNRGDFTSIDVQLFRAVADRAGLFLENRLLYDDLADLLMGLLHALVSSIDAKDAYTCGHSERVAFISRQVAEAAKLPPEKCERVYLSGLLHDVGKIGVPDAILAKPGKLTNEEFDAMKKHPEIGGRILSRVRQVQDLLPGVLHHHERMDGRGYPGGLAGPDIPLLGRIICIADCFDAMTTQRTYRPALSLPAAVAEMRRCTGAQFDPGLTEAFLQLDHARMLREAHAVAGTEVALDFDRRGAQRSAGH